MQGNEYHDIKGHFTDKANDGGTCYHEFGTLKSKSAKEKYIVSKGFKKIRGYGYYHKEAPYIDKWGNEHDIYARYVDGDLFYNFYSLGKKENSYATYEEAKKAWEEKYSIEKHMKPFEWLKKEDPEKYEKIKGEIENRLKRGSIPFGDEMYSFDYEPKSDALKEALKGQNSMKIEELIGGNKAKGLKASFVKFYNFAKNRLDDFEELKKYFAFGDVGSGKQIYGKNEEDLLNNINKKVDEKAEEYRKRNAKFKEEMELEKKQEQKELRYLKGFENLDIFQKDFDVDKFDDDNITFGTRVGGYSGYSQSNSAIASKEQGSMPMSHWTKEEILSYLEDNEQLKPYIDVFKKMSLKKLKDTTLHYDGWHHTGKFYNQTDFYSISSPREIIQSVINDKKEYKFDNGLKKGLGV